MTSKVAAAKAAAAAEAAAAAAAEAAMVAAEAEEEERLAASTRLATSTPRVKAVKPKLGGFWGSLFGGAATTPAATEPAEEESADELVASSMGFSGLASKLAVDMAASLEADGERAILEMQEMQEQEQAQVRSGYRQVLLTLECQTGLNHSRNPLCWRCCWVAQGWQMIVPKWYCSLLSYCTIS